MDVSEDTIWLTLNSQYILLATYHLLLATCYLSAALSSLSCQTENRGTSLKLYKESRCKYQR